MGSRLEGNCEDIFCSIIVNLIKIPGWLERQPVGDAICLFLGLSGHVSMMRPSANCVFCNPCLLKIPKEFSSCLGSLAAWQPTQYCRYIAKYLPRLQAR